MASSEGAARVALLESVQQLMKDNERYEAIGLISSPRGLMVLARDRKSGGAELAIKLIHASSRADSYERLQRTILGHRALMHPHVIELDRVFLVPGKIGIAMEYGDVGNLSDYLLKKQTLPEEVAKFFFQQIIIAVDFCHRKGSSPRDIKLENIVLKQKDDLPLPTVKLCDFGYSECDADSTPRSFIDSIANAAPEVIESQEMAETNPQGLTYDTKLSDVWSCGVVLYALIVGEHPFINRDTANLTDAARELAVMGNIKSLNYTIPDCVPGPCRDLISKCLAKTADRLSIEGVMRHNWMKEELLNEATKLNEDIIAADSEQMARVERKQPRAEILEMINTHMLEQRAQQGMQDSPRGGPSPPGGNI